MDINTIYYPPKPTLMTIDQPLFDELEKDDRYVAELKFNGDHLILKRMSDGSFEFWNRHGKKFKYSPSVLLLERLNSLDWNGDCVCDGELLHSKVTSTKNTVVLWDVLAYAGMDFKMRSFAERHVYLELIFSGERYAGMKDGLFISDQWRSGWREIFTRETQREEIEGLVMKRLDAKLELGRNESPVVKYMYKVRKPCGKYKY